MFILNYLSKNYGTKKVEKGKIEQIRRGFEVIIKSKIITKKEKKKLVIRAIIENIINGNKFIIISPILMIRTIFVILTTIFTTISNFFDIIQETLIQVCFKIDDIKDINLTRCQASRKVIEEIGKGYLIEEKDLKN